MKILIIDDEPLIRMALSRAFKARGHEVLVASNGAEGLVRWESSKPQLVLLDWIMPNMNGYQLLQKLPMDRYGAVVYVISAYTSETNLEELKRLGVKSFIPKPFENVLSLVQKIEGENV